MALPGSSKDHYCIIGAGPSGLAMAAAFRSLGVPYDHLERHNSSGGIWAMDNPLTPMYESAHFISSKTQSALTGFPMPDSYPDYPRHDQVLSYIRAFAKEHDLETKIQFGREVESVVPSQGHARVTSNGKTQEYRGVVCASGLNWDPIVPEIPGDFAGQARHAVTYKSAKEFEGKRVVIVGLGNSGADIACDAARSARKTYVSIRRGYHFVPKHIFGKPADVFAHEGPRLPLWLEQPLFSRLLRLLVGDTTKLGMPKPDHKVLQSHPLLNDQLLHHLRHGDVELCGDIARFDGPRVVFKDNGSVEADLLLFATGYSRKIAYLDESAFDGSWAASHFLTCINRRFDSLFTLGFAELNGALYPHVGRLAALIARIAHAQLHEPSEAERFYEWARKTKFDLSGGRRLIDTPRHAHYCDDHALFKATRTAFKKMSWPMPS